MAANVTMQPENRDPTTGRFVRDEGDFSGPAQFANAPIVEGELGAEHRSQEQPNPRRFVEPQRESTEQEVAIRELPEGEVPSERAMQYEPVEEPAQPQPQPQPQIQAPQPPQPDQNALILEMMNRMLQVQERQLTPPTQPQPPQPSTFERFKTNKDYQRQYIYDISAGRLDPDNAEHYAMAHLAAYMADQIEQSNVNATKQFQELQQFKQELIQAAQFNNASTQAAQQAQKQLAPFAISDDPQAMQQLSQQAAQLILNGQTPEQAVTSTLGPIAKFLSPKNQPQQQRLKTLSPEQQAAMRASATPGKGAGKPTEPRSKDWWKSALGKYEKHIEWE